MQRSRTSPNTDSTEARGSTSALRLISSAEIKLRRPFRGHHTKRVESRCDAVALGYAYLFSAAFVWRCLTSVTMLRFHIPLIEPDMRC
jgi:hypothetical protein